MLTATKPMSKNLKAVVTRMSRRDNYATILKTAVAVGYLADGHGLCTALTPDEVNDLKKLKATGLKNASVEDPTAKFPKVVGLMGKCETTTDGVKVTFPGGETVMADPILTTLLERHRNVTVHAGPKGVSGVLYIATRNGIAATCPILPKEEPQVEEPSGKKKK